MKAKNIVLFFMIVLVMVIVFYSIRGSQDNTEYNLTIEKEREKKDRFMRTSDESPFASDSGNFQGLKYFEPNAAYRIIANLYPIKDKKVVVLKTNDGKDQRYVEYEIGGAHV